MLLHEWSYPTENRPKQQVSELGEVSYEPEPTESVTTWVYDEGTPIGKLINGERYSIVSDYIGRPVQCFNDQGELVWQTDYDIYGRVKNLKGEREFVPFRQLGQYEDSDLGGLYYNRFRYYDSTTGMYISQDPIGLVGGMALYGYVHDSNSWVDPGGLTPISFKGDLSPYQTRYNTNFPGRPDPKFSIDTHTFSSGETTMNGGIRNSKEFWQQWATKNPQTLSKSNLYKINDLGLSPKIDKQWVQHFPEHGGYKGNMLIHHHVNFGRYAIPVPGDTHVGSGGVWHAKTGCR